MNVHYLLLLTALIVLAVARVTAARRRLNFGVTNYEDK